MTGESLATNKAKNAFCFLKIENGGRGHVSGALVVNW